ncbi:MAG: orotate phosphoribosyltransferase [Thaumarchaeota archaeon]|nr:orotate phosphoribosyltransferase [Candidatus Calditenuaceae archaeon]MDW8187090.1 orotate phosphoribosyltransferase [Nitrososphaerota archaeon]
MRLQMAYDDLVQRKGTSLSLSLDPPLERLGTVGARYEYCKRAIEELSDYVVAVKLNENFIRGMSSEQVRSLNEEAKFRECITLLDCKMNDVEHTVFGGVLTISELGFDGFTFNPIIGNSEALVREASLRGLWTFALILPSSPASSGTYLAGLSNGMRLYERLLEDAVTAGSEGFVVGVGPHLEGSILKTIRRRAGDDAVILLPGLGAQGGELRVAARYGGERLLFNYGRSILLAPSPPSRARELRDESERLRAKFSVSEALVECQGAVVESKEPIRLSSGKLSHYYIDTRTLYSFPKSRDKVVRLMVAAVRRIVQGSDFKVATTATAGIPIASLVADRLRVGLVYYRSGAKDHGLGKKIEGMVGREEKFIGVDDLSTTGRTALECVRALREAGGTISEYFVVMDRGEGAREALASEGVRLHALCNVDDEFWEIIREARSS